MKELTKDHVIFSAERIIYVSEKLDRIKEVINENDLKDERSLDRNITAKESIERSLSLALEATKKITELPHSIRERCCQDRNGLAHTDTNNKNRRSAQDFTAKVLWKEFLCPNEGFVWEIEKAINDLLLRNVVIELKIIELKEGASTDIARLPDQLSPAYYEIIESQRDAYEEQMKAVMAFSAIFSSSGEALRKRFLVEVVYKTFKYAENTVTEIIDRMIEAGVFALSPSGEHILISKRSVVESAAKELIESHDINQLMAQMEAFQ